MNQKVRIGMIGAGFAAHFHLASYQKVWGVDFEVAAISGRNRDRASQLAERFGIARVHESIELLLADPTIDAVDICVPNYLHLPLILKAAERGKHVICEKPLGGYFGPTGADDDWSAEWYSRQAMFDAVLADVDRVRESVERAGITFCYGENWVYAPPVVKVGRLMAASQSTIMRIVGEESHSGSHSEAALRWRTAGGGSLARLCVHPIGGALQLKRDEGMRTRGRPIRPVAVNAQVARLTGMEGFRGETRKHVVDRWHDVEDFATLTLTFEDGAVAQLTSTDTHLGGIHNTLTAHGSRAIATANINPNTMCQAYTPDGAYFKSEYIVEKLETKEGWSFPAPDEDAVTGYPEELRDFIGAIAARREPRSGLALATDVMLVVYAGYLSAEQRAVVDLRPHLHAWNVAG
jgi:predicted dehydrogenase